MPAAECAKSPTPAAPNTGGPQYSGGMKLKYTLSPAERSKEFKLSNRSQLNVVRTVYEGLDARRRKLLKGGCFKHLLSMPDLKVSGTIIHHLIMRSSETISDEECWFIIGGHPLRFSLIDFGLVTGLKVASVDLGVDEPVGKNSPLVQNYFSHLVKVYREDVLKAFGSPICTNPVDKYKLGLILILAYVVIGLDDVKAISFWWFDLVEDLKSFNKYPWGILSYKMTTEVLRRDLSVPLNNKTVAYAVHGFPLSIMVWAFESIPSIAEYATKLEVEKFPRMMNWKLTKKRFKSSEIEEALEIEEMAVISELVITDTERRCIFGAVDTCNAETEKKEPDEKCGEVKILKILHQLEGEIDAFVETASIGEKTEFVKMLHRLERKIGVDIVVSGSEDKNENGNEEFSVVDKVGAVIEESTDLDKVCAVIEESTYLDKVGAGIEESTDLDKDGAGIEESTDLDKDGAKTERSSFVVKASGVRKKRGKSKFEIIQDVEVEKAEQKGRMKGGKRRKFERVVTEHDPFTEIDPAKIEYLDKWLVTDALVRHDVSVLHDRFIDSNELKTLLKTGWISSPVMEAGIDILRERMREQPTRFQIGACIMDPWFSGFVKRLYKQSSSFITLDNRNMLPGILGGQTWSQSRHIYFTVCSNRHWFACKLDITEQCIYVYDSLPKHIRKSEFDEVMKPFSVMIPRIYSLVGGGAKLTLTVQKVTGLVVQENGNDCGFYAMKFIECLVRKQDLGRLKSLDMHQCRKNLVAELLSVNKTACSETE